MTIITRKMCLNPKCLNANIYDFILKELVEQTKKDCSYNYGYILSITKIIRVIDGFNISPINCDIVCEVEFEAETLKPCINDIHEGIVCAILPKVGILMEVKKCLKILVKSDSLREYVYDEKNNTYVSANKNISVNDTIKVKIRGVKYTDHKFCCFGDFIEV